MDTEKLKQDNELMAEQLNQLSEVLLGCRESKFHEMIMKAQNLKMKAQNVELANQFRDIADAIGDLKDMADDVMSDA